MCKKVAFEAFCGPDNTPKCVSGWGSAPYSAGRAHGAPPDLLVGWEGNTILPPSVLATKTRRTVGTSVWQGGGCPQIFSSRTAYDGTPHFTNTLLLRAANMKPAPGGK